MPTQGSNVLTLIDWAKRLDPTGQIAIIVEFLNQTNEMLDDMLWIMANGETHHRTTIRTGLPTVAWRLLNQGTQPSKSRTAQIDEGMGMLEAWSEVDVKLAKLNGNMAAFRLSESQPFIEAMGQEMAQTFLFGNSGVAPEEFTGLSVRYGDLSAENAQNILDAQGVGADNSSAWLVGWGRDTVCGIFPKMSQAGLQHKDLGEGVVQDANGIGGARMLAFRDQYTWDGGLALKDWRYAVRIANIDISNLVTESSAADLFKEMIRATHRIPSLSRVRPSFYLNRTCFQQLDIQARDSMIGSALKYEEIAGKRIMTFRGIPVRLVDQLIETEAQVV